ncbi:hypothetical protein FNF27_03915 [Cafeteria roenbergensis]|uniref:Uncharacterized protein n=1 Tax=Cafeteria roenbergensis TaxID=33653 RepID=A0A5A8EFH0_CAFRO|nr:hypothetical protein FNF27_03915 [Cafeteria roenbergensis]
MLAASSDSLDSSTFAFKSYRKLDGHLGKVYAQHWSGDENRLVSASQDGKLIDWNARTGSKVHLVNLISGWVMTCGFDPSESPRFVASGGLDNACTIYDVSADSPIISESKTVLAGHDGYLSCCRFIKGTNSIVTSSGDTTCIVWDVVTEAPTVRLTDHAGDVMSVSLHPDNTSQFVSGSTDMRALLWDVRTGGPVATFMGHEGDINAVDFMPNGLAFATASDDHTIRIFDIRALGCVAAFSAKQAATSVACSKSSRLVVAGFEDAAARGWKTVSTEKMPVVELKHSEDPAMGGADAAQRISCVGFNASGSALSTGSWDHSLEVWAQA